MKDIELMSFIKSGAVGVLPTDTVYGLVCSASNQQSVQRLYELKSREMKPGTLVAASIDQLVELGIPRRYLTAVEKYWPGAISIVVPLGLKLQYLHQSKGSIAVRIPSDQKFRALLVKIGPLLTSSANHPGKPPAVTEAAARAYFGDSIDFYVDGGDLSNREASTIIRVVDDAVEVLRQGAVKINELGEVQTDATE